MNHSKLIVLIQMIKLLSFQRVILLNIKKVSVRLDWQLSFKCMPHYLKKCVHSSGQKYFNIALVLQDECLTIFTHPANICTCSLKVYTIKNIRE